MALPSFSSEAALASVYGPDRFNSDERRLLASVKEYVDGLSPDTVITTEGDLIVGNSSGNAARLARGTSGLPLVAGASTLSYTTLGNSAIASNAAIAYSKLNLGSSIVAADISPSAAIPYSKLSLTNSLLDADINSAAAIAYSKLNLSASLVNADVAAAAAIAHSKLANITAGSVLLGNGSNVPTATALTGDVTVNSSGVTAIASNVIDVNDFSLTNSTVRVQRVTVSYTDLNAAGSGVAAFFGSAIPDKAWIVYSWYRVRTTFTGNGNSGSVIRMGVGDNAGLKAETGITSGSYTAGTIPTLVTATPSSFFQNSGAQIPSLRWTAAGTDSALASGLLDLWVHWVPGN
jgi:hypothetical protein